MAHFARVDKDNIVQNVIVVDNEQLLNEQGVEEEDVGKVYLNKIYGYGYNWIQTSYHTYANQHPQNKPFRKNYAGIGHTYDKDRDAFIPPKPYNSWILDEDTCRWHPPQSYPDDEKSYQWNEDTTSWDEVDMGDR
jgi:hypothetical protein